MPRVDGVIELNTGIGALPGGLGHLAEEVASVNLLDDLVGGTGPKPEPLTFLHGMHEVITDAHRVVGVLVLHRVDVLAANPHVEASSAEGADLVLLARLGLDELLDVGVINVEDDHLGSSASGTTGLDGSGRGIGTPHEGDRPGGGPATAQQLLGGTNPGDVDSSARTALEDHSLLGVPVQDRLHRVVHREDEAGADLLWAGSTDVEPDRGVEAEVLVQQQPREFLAEHRGIGIGGEVTILLAGAHVNRNDTVDERLEAGLALHRAQGTTEVLVRHDRGGIGAPEIGELHPTLFEDDLIGTPVRLDDVATLPGDLVVGMSALSTEEPLYVQPLASRIRRARRGFGFGHDSLCCLVVGGGVICRSGS